MIFLKMCDCGCGQWYLDRNPAEHRQATGNLPTFEAFKPAALEADKSVVDDELEWLETLIRIADSGQNLVMYNGNC